MIKILFLSTSLSIGGAELALENLITGLDRNKFDIQIVSLTELDIVGQSLMKKGFPVKAFNLQKKSEVIQQFFSLLKFIKAYKPDIIQSWMYHADFVSVFCKIARWKTKLVWGIRNNTVDKKNNKRTAIIRKLCAVLSYSFPSKIVSCAEQVANEHQRVGYKKNKMLVIQNGFQLKTLPISLQSQVAPFDKKPGDKVIGLFARFHPDKDHLTFILALNELMKTLPNFVCVLCGNEINWQNPLLEQWIEENNLKSRMILLGLRTDVSQLYQYLDLFVLSSMTEGFPNVVTEAMGNGIPCVVTNVGDAAKIVGDFGWVVPSKNSKALADAINEALSLPPHELEKIGKNAAKHIEDNYSMRKFISAYENTYMSVFSS